LAPLLRANEALQWQDGVPTLAKVRQVCQVWRGWRVWRVRQKKKAG
jgi:hypothetical protein